MARMQVPVVVEMDDGRKLSVMVDQRDFARAEAQQFPEGARHTQVRFHAWSAMTRTKQYGGSWEDFNTTDCIEATDVPEESDDDDEGVDPGRTDQSAGN